MLSFRRPRFYGPTSTGPDRVPVKHVTPSRRVQVAWRRVQTPPALLRPQGTGGAISAEPQGQQRPLVSLLGGGGAGGGTREVPDVIPALLTGVLPPETLDEPLRARFFTTARKQGCCTACAAASHGWGAHHRSLSRRPKASGLTRCWAFTADTTVPSLTGLCAQGATAPRCICRIGVEISCLQNLGCPHRLIRTVVSGERWLLLETRTSQRTAQTPRTPERAVPLGGYRQLRAPELLGSSSDAMFLAGLVTFRRTAACWP